MIASVLGASQETGFVVSSFKSAVDDATRKYAVFVPKRYAETKTAWPVLLFLHGYGESGDDIELVRRHGPIKEAPQRPQVGYGSVIHAGRTGPRTSWPRSLMP